MDGLLAAADALCALVRGSYGPSGDEVLVFAPPDAPLITVDGHAVLRAKKQQNANAAHSTASPFERVILDAAESVYREAGDGVTQFVILLHGVLHHVTHGERLDTSVRVRIARALGTLRHEWDANKLLPANAQSCLVMEEPVELEMAANNIVTLSPAIQTRTMQVLTTALTGVLGQRAVHQLVKLVMRWIFTTTQAPTNRAEITDPLKRLHRYLQLYQQQAPRAIVHAPGESFAASYVVEADEFVLQKPLIPSQLPSILGGVTLVRFVCVTSSLDLTVGSNLILYEPPNQVNAVHAVDHLRMRVVQFLTELRERYDVRLLISTEKIEDYVAAACNHLEIACVQYAESEDVTALCCIASVHAIASVMEELEEELHIGVCSKGVTVARHGPSTALRLRGLRMTSSQETGIIPQLVVHASSKAVFKQYYNALLKSFRVLRCLFTPDHSGSYACIRLCRGAGATELMIAKALRLNEEQNARAGTAVDPSLQQATLALSTALVESVAQLHTNLTQGCGTNDPARANRQSCRALLDEMSRIRCWKETTLKGYVLDMDHAIETKLGSVRIPTLVEGDPLDFHILHPWRRIDTIVHTVLQTAERLLRVDAVVHIKRNPDRQKAGLHEASK